MSDQNTYNYTEVLREGFLRPEDSSILNSFRVATGFDYSTDSVELYVYSFDGSFLLEDINYSRFRVIQEGSTSQNKVSTLEVDPIEDAKFYNFNEGDVNFSYNFIRRITENNSLFIDSISPDRTELLLYSVSLTDVELVSIANNLSNEFRQTGILPRIVLRIDGENYLQIVNVGVNQIAGKDSIKVKLYESLPPQFTTKVNVSLAKVVSEPVEYGVTREQVFTEPVQPTLRGPNFNVEVQLINSNPTSFESENDIISGSSGFIYSKVAEPGAEINVDYSDYGSFVHFSSAQERLNNFQYKLLLIKDYEASESEVKINEVFSGFDHYDRFLYFESGSYSWPKTLDIPDNPTGSAAIAFFNSQSLNATFFDETNPHRLLNTVPSFLREDPNNQPYNLFIDMIGQHFDNVWLYAKGMTDRYDGDNRLDFGISKDLVADALRGFGVKLYGSSLNLEGLFSMFAGSGIVTGSEQINTAISASNTDIPLDDYQKEIYKRLYHNTPLLLKSKGTERGLRALLNVFGIPKNILDIRLYGGQNTDLLPFYGPFYNVTGSIDKIRLENTGSIYENTLSQNTFITQLGEKYTQDTNLLEVGFSPTTNIDNFLQSSSLSNSGFDLDDYIGDPGLYNSSEYSELNKFAEETFSGSLERYNLFDFVRLLKYYDNTLFKMVKDFTPARTNTATGFVIKPHILERNKVKSVEVSFTQPEYSGSIEIGDVSSTYGFNKTGDGYVPALTSSYGKITVLKEGGTGVVRKLDSLYTGEFGAARSSLGTITRDSKILLTNGELNQANRFKRARYRTFPFRITLLTDVPADLDLAIGTVTHISP